MSRIGDLRNGRCKVKRRIEGSLRDSRTTPCGRGFWPCEKTGFVIRNVKVCRHQEQN